MDKVIGYRVYVAPEFEKSFESSVLLVHASCFIFEQEGTPYPMITFQVDVGDDDEPEYETIVTMPTKAIAMVERVILYTDAEQYFSVSCEPVFTKKLPRMGV